MLSLSFLTLLYQTDFIGFIVQIGSSVLMIKYAFIILRTTAQGRFSAPKISSDLILGDLSSVFKQLILFFIIGYAFIWITGNLGIALGMLFIAFAILALPAMIIMLVATEKLVAALNPVLFVSLALRIGWGYLLMYLFLIMLMGAPKYLGQFLFESLPNGLQLFLFAFVECYYTFIAYHLMGYVLLQYNEEIGYEVDVEEEELIEDGTIEKRSNKSDLLTRVDMLIQDGKIDDAITMIKKETGDNQITDINLAERYHKLLNIKQLAPEMLEHAKLYIDMLIKQKAGLQLCAVYQDCISKDPEFMAYSPASLKIAGFLNGFGKPQEAVQVYNRFIKADPKNNLVPKAYFLAAGVFNEKLKNREKAAGILNAVIKKYPHHEITPFAQRYLKQMTSLKQDGKRASSA